MQLYDDPTTVTTPPALPAAGTPGYFTDGVPGSVGRTLVRAWWLNQIALELVNIVNAAGITPSRSINNQVLTALQTLFTVPAASQTVAGKAQLATPAQVEAGTDNILATTSLGVAGAITQAIAPLATTTALTAETTRAEAAETTLNSAISTEITNRTAAIAAETSRAEAAEATLNPKLVGNWSSPTGPWWDWNPTTGHVRVSGNLIQSITVEGEITIPFPVNIGAYRTGRAGTLNSTGSNAGSAAAQPVSGSATSMIVMINDSQTGGAAFATGVWFEADGYSETEPAAI